MKAKNAGGALTGMSPQFFATPSGDVGFIQVDLSYCINKVMVNF